MAFDNVECRGSGWTSPNRARAPSHLDVLRGRVGYERRLRLFPHPPQVDLTGACSNPSPQVSELRDLRTKVSETINGTITDCELNLPEVRSTPRQPKITERVPATDLQQIMNFYQAGSTGKELADRFGISHSSVKRLLRRNGVRRR